MEKKTFKHVFILVDTGKGYTLNLSHSREKHITDTVTKKVDIPNLPRDGNLFQ